MSRVFGPSPKLLAATILVLRVVDSNPQSARSFACERGLELGEDDSSLIGVEQSQEIFKHGRKIPCVRDRVFARRAAHGRLEQLLLPALALAEADQFVEPRRIALREDRFAEALQLGKDFVLQRKPETLLMADSHRFTQSKRLFGRD
jgi:hypothetical protein